MKTRLSFIAAAVVFVLAALLFFWSSKWEGEEKPAGISMIHRRTGGEATTIVGSGSKAAAPQSLKEARQFYQGILAKYSRDTALLDVMVERAAEKEGALVAAFAISMDDKYLKELEKYSSSAKACALLACFADPKESRLEWAKKLTSLSGGSFGPLMEVDGLLREKRNEEALKLLSGLAAEGKYKIPETEILSDVNTAWQSLGFDLSTSRVLAVNNGVIGSFSSFVEASLDGIWKAQQAEVLTEQELLDAAGVQMGLIENYRISFRPTRSIDYHSRIMEENVLKSLPQDAEYGREGYTIEDHLRDVKAAQQTLHQQSMLLGEAMASASPEVMNQYNDLCYLEGENAARSWLLKVHSQK